MEGFLISGKNGVFFNDSSVQDQWFMFWMRLINQWTLNTNGLVLVLIAVPKYICTCRMKYLMPPQSSTKRFFEWLQNSSVQLAEHSTYFSAYDSTKQSELTAHCFKNYKCINKISIRRFSVHCQGGVIHAKWVYKKRCKLVSFLIFYQVFIFS